MPPRCWPFLPLLLQLAARNYVAAFFLKWWSVPYLRVVMANPFAGDTDSSGESNTIITSDSAYYSGELNLTGIVDPTICCDQCHGLIDAKNHIIYGLLGSCAARLHPECLDAFRDSRKCAVCGFRVTSEFLTAVRGTTNSLYHVDCWKGGLGVKPAAKSS